MLSHHFLDASIHSAACWTLVVSAMCDFRKHCQSRLLSSCWITIFSPHVLYRSQVWRVSTSFRTPPNQLANKKTQTWQLCERDLCWGWWFVTLYINGYVRWASNSGFSKGHGLFESPGKSGGFLPWVKNSHAKNGVFRRIVGVALGVARLYRTAWARQHHSRWESGRNETLWPQVQHVFPV